MEQSPSSKRFSSAMEHMGNPAEMSPNRELSQKENLLPFVEVTSPLPSGNAEEREDLLEK